MNFRTWIRDNCFTYGYVPCVVFLGWLLDNQMWGRAAMLVEEMGDEWGRVSFRLDRELIEEYAAELWGMKIDYVDVEEHVLELGKLIVDKYEEKYHLDCNLGELGGV